MAMKNGGGRKILFFQYSQPGVFQLFWSLIHGLGPWELTSDSFEEHQAGKLFVFHTIKQELNRTSILFQVISQFTGNPF